MRRWLADPGAGRFALASLAGGGALLAWGMLFWGLLAPRLAVFRALPDAASVTSALEQGGTSTGTYFMPWPRDTPESRARFVAQHRSGPFYRLSFVAHGVDPSSPGKLLVGALQYLLVAIVAVGLVVVARVTGRRRRFLTVVLAGVMGSLFISASDPLWFHLPWDHARGLLLYELVAWTLLAAVVAAMAPAGPGVAREALRAPR